MGIVEAVFEQKGFTFPLLINLSVCFDDVCIDKALMKCFYSLGFVFDVMIDFLILAL
jgi:hypothetical protein